MYNNSSFIGSIGEAVAIAEFTKRGIPVSKTNNRQSSL